MKRKRALIYVVACLLCATLATVTAFKVIKKTSANAAPIAPTVVASNSGGPR